LRLGRTPEAHPNFSDDLGGLLGLLFTKDDPFCATALAGKLPIEDTLAIEHAANHACIATPGECIIFSELV
jgi:hypothetical protein